MYQPTKEELERRKRIQISLYAFAYECEDNPLVPDDRFDQLAKSIDLSVKTGNNKMDKWFENNFHSYTGSWITNHPELDGIRTIYWRLTGLMPKGCVFK